MNQPSSTSPWLRIVGLVLGAGLLGITACDSVGPSAKPGKPQPANNSHVVALTAANWEKEVVESPVPVLVDFTAAWCPPCKILAPTIEGLAEKYQGKVKVAKFDVGDGSFNNLQPLASKHNYLRLRGVPTVMLFKGGGPPVWSEVGAASEEVYVQAIEALRAER